MHAPDSESGRIDHPHPDERTRKKKIDLQDAAATLRYLLGEVVSITDRASETRQDLLVQLGTVIASTHAERSRSWDRASEDAYFEDESAGERPARRSQHPRCGVV
jgi:hypothetical protein